MHTETHLEETKDIILMMEESDQSAVIVEKQGTQSQSVL